MNQPPQLPAAADAEPKPPRLAVMAREPPALPSPLADAVASRLNPKSSFHRKRHRSANSSYHCSAGRSAPPGNTSPSHHRACG